MKKTTSICLLITLAIFSNCQDLNTKKIDPSKIEKMTIQMVDFSIMTIVNVDCDKYEDFFGQNYKSATTSDSVIINKFIKIINLLEPINSNYSKCVDTRVIIKLFARRETFTICIGQLSCSISNLNDLYITSNLLLDFIQSLPVSK
jgi:hypothetical protein